MPVFWQKVVDWIGRQLSWLRPKAQMVVMPVFDAIERTEALPADHLISKFDYLNESGRQAAQQVRDQMGQMFARYPAEHADEMRRRLRSRDDTLHQSAFFELPLHELLIRQGFTIEEVEPVLANGRAPDFLVASPQGDRFYLEATLASGQPAATAGAERRMREALQAIDDVQSPGFFLSLHPRGTPDRPVAVARLRRDIQRFVDALDHATVIADLAAGRPWPTFEREEHGALFRIEAVPKGRLGGGNLRAIGVRMMAPMQVQPQDAIKSAVLGKAGRYGDPDLPFVIAVNSLEDYARADDAEDALFGSHAVGINAAGEDRWIRNPDGVWHTATGPGYSRVSAVLSTERVYPWSLGQRRARLIYNPWARRPLPDVPLGLDIVRIVDNVFQRQDGQPLGEILGLPEDWPTDD